MLRVWRTQDREEVARDQAVGECCCEIVKMSRANLQPMAMCRTSTSVKPSRQSGRNANVRKQEEEIVVSVVLVIIRRSEVKAGPHGTAAVCLKLTNAVYVPVKTELASRSAVR